MEKYVILADVACDLSAEIREEFGITECITGHVTLPDGKDIPALLDWSQISRTDFYKALSNRGKVTSAPANVEEYCKIFRKYVDEGYAVLSMSLSSKISSTYAFACMAAAQVREACPDANIYCLDSFRMSGAFGLLVLHAQDLKNQGKSFQEVIDWLEANKRRVHQMGPIDDLMFVARRGRITMGKAIMGSFAGIKPMGDCNTDGYVTVISKAKGIKKALRTTVRYVAQTAKNIEDQYMIISHSDREEYAMALKEQLEAAVKPKKVFVSDVFCLCGTNIGPGMVGVYYLGDDVSPDLLIEKRIIAKIMQDDVG